MFELIAFLVLVGYVLLFEAMALGEPAGREARRNPQESGQWREAMSFCATPVTLPAQREGWIAPQGDSTGGAMEQWTRLRSESGRGPSGS